MSNEEIVRLLQTGKDSNGDLLTQLWLQNKGFIAMTARKYAGYAELDDLIQEGFCGLCEAVKHWDSSAGTLFMTYASYWIRQAMTRYVEKQSPTSIPMYRDIMQYKRFVTEYHQKYSCDPTDAETCSTLKITKEQLVKIKKAARKMSAISLDSPVGDDRDNAVGDLIPSGVSTEDAILEKVQHEQLKKDLWTEVDALPPDASKVIRGRYQNRKTRAEIAAECGYSQSVVRDLEERSLKKLKRSKRLKPYESDYISSHAYRGSLGQFNRTWTSSTEQTAIDLMTE